MVEDGKSWSGLKKWNFWKAMLVSFFPFILLVFVGISFSLSFDGGGNQFLMYVAGLLLFLIPVMVIVCLIKNIKYRISFWIGISELVIISLIVLQIFLSFGNGPLDFLLTSILILWLVWVNLSWISFVKTK